MWLAPIPNRSIIFEHILLSIYLWPNNTFCGCRAPSCLRLVTRLLHRSDTFIAAVWRKVQRLICLFLFLRLFFVESWSKAKLHRRSLFCCEWSVRWMWTQSSQSWTQDVNSVIQRVTIVHFVLEPQLWNWWRQCWKLTCFLHNSFSFFPT